MTSVYKIDSVGTVVVGLVVGFRLQSFGPMKFNVASVNICTGLTSRNFIDPFEYHMNY